MAFKQRFKTKAFTLIEVSIVILIVGIMIAGTFIGNRLVAKSRLAAAESLARSSPVPGIKDNMLWLETSLSASIDSSQASDGAAVTAWYD
jgi:prepilin-type N-terminal cleavage/methylation domain-containing protein